MVNLARQLPNYVRIQKYRPSRIVLGHSFSIETENIDTSPTSILWDLSYEFLLGPIFFFFFELKSSISLAQGSGDCLAHFLGHVYGYRNVLNIIISSQFHTSYTANCENLNYLHGVDNI